MVDLQGKKARIVICGNFQEVHPDEFTASKTPSYPSLRMALSVASHMGWPIECWDVSTAFLYARLFGDKDTDLGGNEIFMKPPKILVETKVVEDGLVWKIKKALYGLRTSPIAWETERDATLKDLTWCHNETEYRLLPCPGSPCLWTVIPFHPGEDPSVKTSSEELARGVVITYVDDLLLTGWQHHIESITNLGIRWCRQTGSRQSTPLSTIRTRYGNSVLTPEATRTGKTQQNSLQKGSRYGISVSTPHRRYGHRLRTPFLRTRDS